MKITVIGTGYVGLPTGVGLAELGNEVVCLDIDEKKINTLKSGKVTIFEEGLEELFQKNTANGKVRFSTSFAESIPAADLVILAVGTPPNPITKEADMKYIKAAAEELAHHLQGYTVIAVKSTVPVNTGDAVESIIRRENPTAEFPCRNFCVKASPYTTSSIRTGLSSARIPNEPRISSPNFMPHLKTNALFSMCRASLPKR